MQRLSQRPVKTFTIGFSEPRFNEAEHAAAIAGHLGTEHHELYVSPRQCLDVVGQLPAVYDEPFADVSQVPTLLVSQLAGKHVKVVLSGDGGDELFCGYTHYREAWNQWRLMQVLPLALRRRLRRLAVRSAVAGWHRFGNRERTAHRMPGWQRTGTRLEKRTRGWEYATPQQLLLARTARYTNPEDLVIQSAGADSNIASVQHWVTGVGAMLMMRHLDYIGYLPGDILVKVDRASMSVGLEVRAPLLDIRVTEFAWSLPESFLVDHRGGKRILREVMDRYVPPRLTTRPKRGFSPPVEEWLRGPLREWAESLLAPATLGEQGYFNPRAVREIWDQHLAGWRNHSNLLWALLMFQSWLGCAR
jgi:asparagine synthase (glutamine-hydrolysing)